MFKLIRLPYNLRYSFHIEVKKENRQRIVFIAILYIVASLGYLSYNLISPIAQINKTLHILTTTLLLSAIALSLLTLLLLSLPAKTRKSGLSTIVQKSFLLLMVFLFLLRGLLSTKYDLRIETFSLGIILMAIAYRGSPLFIATLIIGSGLSFICGSFMVLHRFSPFPAIPVTIYTVVAMLLHLHMENNRLKLFMLNSRLKERNRELEQLSFRDELTQLHNRRYIMEHLRKLKSSRECRQNGLALLLIDIDFFKRINDTMGHPVGDRVLKEFSQVLQESVRGSDLVGRMGGEEFIVVLPNTGKSEAMELAERVRVRIREFNFTALSSRLTVSIGCGMLKEDDSLETLIERVDSRLYRAKRNGRNQVK